MFIGNQYLHFQLLNNLVLFNISLVTKIWKMQQKNPEFLGNLISAGSS